MSSYRETILRLIICAHFVFVSIVLLASWLPVSYHLSQYVIMILGFWSIVHHENVIALELLMVIKTLSIVLDSIAIGMYFEIGKNGAAQQQLTSYFVISALFAILLLVLKPIMVLLLLKVRQDRVGDPNYGIWNPASGYMPVDGR